MAQAAPIAMIGLSALGTVNSISQANAQKKFSNTRTRLQLAQARREESEQLARGLARQNLVAGARGATASTGSLLQQAFAASRQAANNVQRARAGAAITNAGSTLRARGAVSGSILSFGRGLLGQGEELLED
jgi:hypothetical protein